MSTDKKRESGQGGRTYTVELTRAAVRALQTLPRPDQRRMATRIDGLSKNPRPPGNEKLKGADDLYRVRQGDYRIIYTIKDATLLVVITIGNRRDVYR